jgi:hypothetical protein
MTASWNPTNEWCARAHSAQIDPRVDQDRHLGARCLVNGVPGVVVTFAGQPMTVMGFIIAAGRIAEIDAIADPERVPGIAAAVLTDE